MLELLKVFVQPIVLERDESGTIVGEKVGEAQPCYSLEEVVSFAEKLRSAIEKENASVNTDANSNGNGGVVANPSVSRGRL